MVGNPSYHMIGDLTLYYYYYWYYEVVHTQQPTAERTDADSVPSGRDLMGKSFRLTYPCG